MTCVFVQIRCNPGKTYAVADTIYEREIASELYSTSGDYDLLMKYSSGNITDSFRFFTELSQTKGIPVLSSVPGFSTHCEELWLSPLTNWNEL